MENIGVYAKDIWSFLILDETGKVVSLIGTLISIYIGFTIRDIKKRVLFKVRAPELASFLKEKASNLNNLMLNFDENKGQIEAEVALSLEALKNAKEKVSGMTKDTIKTAISKINKYRNSNVVKSRDSVREIYIQILISEQAIMNQIEDVRMES